MLPCLYANTEVAPRRAIPQLLFGSRKCADQDAESVNDRVRRFGASSEFKVRSVPSSLTSRVQHDHLLAERPDKRLKVKGRIDIEIHIEEFSDGRLLSGWRHIVTETA